MGCPAGGPTKTLFLGGPPENPSPGAETVKKITLIMMLPDAEEDASMDDNDDDASMDDEDASMEEDDDDATMDDDDDAAMDDDNAARDDD